MKYDDLVNALANQGFFDLATVALLSGEKRETLRVQLSRWCKAGKIIALRRGMYAFPQKGIFAKINPALLANALYAPSYLSCTWALGYYGLIPEKVVVFTSVTQRATRSFQNPLGDFTYQTLKATAFFGYQHRDIAGEKVLMADPEKALLDLWHLDRGLWDEVRMEGMRFQNRDLVNTEQLKRYARRYESPRLVKAAELWSGMEDEEKGARVL